MSRQPVAIMNADEFSGTACGRRRTYWLVAKDRRGRWFVTVWCHEAKFPDVQDQGPFPSFEDGYRWGASRASVLAQSD